MGIKFNLSSENQMKDAKKRCYGNFIVKWQLESEVNYNKGKYINDKN